MPHRRSRLARAKPTRTPNRRFILFCEGKNTEPGYFHALERHLKSPIIKVETQAVGAPWTIAERAIARAKQEKLIKGSRSKPENSFEEGDEIWAIFDRDEHPRYVEAIELCRSKGIKVGRSNPCFEIWLILHKEDFHSPDDRHQVCRRLRVLQPEYDPAGSKECNWAELIKNIEMAEQRALNQLVQRENEGDPFGRPSTTVACLTASIRRAALESNVKK